MAYVTQQIIKTTEGWATFDALGKPVPKDYWLFERVTETVGDITQKYYKFKLSDGVSLFADLSYQLLNGHSASINEAGNWLVYDDATQVYKDSGVKAIGVNGKSAFELWQDQEGNADKTLVDFFIYLKGEKGDAFTFDDFTIEQLALLKGASAYQVWKAQDGNEDKTVDEYLQYIKGAPFTYADFTPEQIIALTGKSAYQIWLDQPGNEGKTIEQYLIAIKGQDGQSAYLDAKAKGYAGTKDEFDTLLARIGEGGVGGYLNLDFLMGAEGNFVSSITQEQLKIIRDAYDNKVVAAQIGQMIIPISIEFVDNVCHINITNHDISGGMILSFAIKVSINTDALSLRVEATSESNNYLDMSPLYDGSNNPLDFVPADFLNKLESAVTNKVSSVLLQGRVLPAMIIRQGDFWSIYIYLITGTKGVYLETFNYTITISTRAIVSSSLHASIEVKGDGAKALMDDGTYKPVISPTDVVTLTSLSSLSPTKYSQKYTYTTTTAQPINFSSSPTEGFECILDIKNGTASQIIQAIPNAAAWQCEETSLVIPANKVGCISIRYVHGKYCVRVGL